MKRYFVTVVCITVVTIGLTRCADLIIDAKLSNAFSAEKEALDSFEFTDFAFLSRPDPSIDERIVLVNLGKSRTEIAQQLESINKLKPSVIGLYSFFNCVGCSDSLTDVRLSNAINHEGNVVLIAGLHQSDSLINTNSSTEQIDSVELSDPIFDRYSRHGFSNLFTVSIEKNGFQLYKTCREFMPFIRVKNKILSSFAVEIVNQFDSTKVKYLRGRNNDQEFINYRGNYFGNPGKYPEVYRVIDTKKIDRGLIPNSEVENKIVLIGFLGDSTNVQDSENEKYYTPLNLLPIGRSTPDMYSTVIHANIISMILNEDYINVFSKNGEYAFAFLACLFHVMLLLALSKKYPLYFDLISIGLVFIQIEVLSVMRLFMFTVYNYKADLNVTLGTLAIASIVVNLYQGLFTALVDRYRNNRKIKAKSPAD